MKTIFNEIILAAWLHSVGVHLQKSARKAADGIDSAGTDFFTMVKDCCPPDVDADTVIRLLTAADNTGAVASSPLPEADAVCFGRDVLAVSSALSRGLPIGSDGQADGAAEAGSASTNGPVPLINILTTVQLGERAAPKPAYNALRPLEKDAVLPVGNGKPVQQDYDTHIRQFMHDFQELKGLPYKHFLPALISLLEHYWWCIPVGSGQEQDVSIFQHTKITAAFTAALYRYHTQTDTLNNTALHDSTTKKFRLVTGDMSGIQKYIFDLQIPKHTAKLLRARSFQLWALSEVCASYIIEECGLSAANIITTAGGKFLILVHNTEEAVRQITGLQEHLETYFLKEFAGKLFFILSDGAKASASDMLQANIPQCINETGYNAEVCKQYKMQKALMKHGHLFDRLYADLQQHGACAFCGVFPAETFDDDKPICSRCRDLKEIGEKLVKANKVVFYSEKLRTMAPFGDLAVIRVKDTKEFGAVINEFQPGLPCINLPYTAPKENNAVKMFEDIVKDAAGTQKLAMFKADIDNLGLVFTASLGTRLSLTRYAEMSRLLHYFFSTYYYYFTETNPAYTNKIYTVFSGGDDLCVLGPWNIILEFAYGFRKELQKLTNNNPSLTLSGGIVLTAPSLPVRNIAEAAEEQLEASKNRTEKSNSQMPVKNAITVFNTPVTWEDFSEYLEYGKQLLHYLQHEKIGTASVYRLIDFANRAESAEKGRLRDMIWMSNFRYSIARTIAVKKDDMLTDLFLKFGTPDSIRKSRIAASYALYANRKIH